MAYRAVFERVEIKYLLTAKERQAVLEAMEGHMLLDRYGRTEIRNIYFDSPVFLLARRSNDKPFYKEKLRVRSYGPASLESDVFVELKKKYDGIVYKRRMTLPYDRAMGWLCDGEDPGKRSQIRNEIDYMLTHYGDLAPAMFLRYERMAYLSLDGSDFRLTMDDGVRARFDDFDLCGPSHGGDVLPEGRTLMELKIPRAIPKWLVDTMTEYGIYKESFSKYGSAYKQFVLGIPVHSDRPDA